MQLLASTWLLLVLTMECYHAVTATDCLCLDELDGNLTSPVELAAPPGDYEDERLFVVEHVGMVHFYKNGVRQDPAFLDLSAHVVTGDAPIDDRGLYGIAFHPEFQDNGYVFASMTVDDNGKTLLKVSRFGTKTDAREEVDFDSEKIILTVHHPSNRTIGGELFFDPDGYLYVTVGDEDGQAQDKTNNYGSVLRIDVNTADPGYNVPADNPFQDSPVFAYGLRNPWGCGMDPGDPDTGDQKGRIFCGDVGESSYEEINHIKSGKNYGWNLREGPECLAGKDCVDIEHEEFPIYYYAHVGFSAVIGGRFYRGSRNPSLAGKYIFGDISRDLWALAETSGEWKAQKLELCEASVCEKLNLTNAMSDYLYSFGQDKKGEVYVLSTDNLQTAVPGGKAQKLVLISDGDPSSANHLSHVGIVMATVMTILCMLMQ